MKTIVVVCIYDRYENLKKWVHSWNSSNIKDSKLFIVNNIDEEEDNSYWKKYCEDRGVNFLSRRNRGYETGVIQDIFLGRMFKEQNWDILLFATDDTIPINKNFIQKYEEVLKNENIGVAAMEISGVWTPHIRTTGFAITKNVANLINFVHNPILTKDECYFFEHQGFQDTLMSQVLNLDKRVIQLTNLKESYMWDTHHHEDHNRWEEWNKEFPGYN